MSGHTDKTWRLIAYIREMASLGFGGVQSARMLGVSEKLVHALGCTNKISFKAHRMESALRRNIRAGYTSGRSPAQIAIEVGTSVASVKVLASKMGLTRDSTRDPGKWKRGFSVPTERKPEYRSLRKVGLTMKECGYVMGLLQRPRPALRSAHSTQPIPHRAESGQ